MKKILFVLLLLFFIVPLKANAEIRQSEVNNTVAMESAFTYKEPLSDNSPAQTTAVKTADIFSIYVKSTRFYNRSKTNFRAHIELDITSKTELIDLLFDKDCPPKIEYIKDGQTHVLPLKKVYYNDQYFISFKLKSADLDALYTADAVNVIFPVITNGSNVDYKKDKNGQMQKIYVKQSLEKTSTTIEKSYTIPHSIIAEWQKVLTSDLQPGSITDTL